MADTNLTESEDLVALSIDFVNNFNYSVQSLLNALQGVQRIPMAKGSTIQTYKTTVTKATSNTVGEGEEIPLTKVSRKKDKAYVLTLNNKLRKNTSWEAIQDAGFDQAINFTDQQLLQIAQKNAKTDLFNALSSNATTKITAAGFQQAVSQSLGKLAGIFEDYDGAGNSVVFVNPDDFYSWLGNQQIITQSAFGLTYIKNFLNAGTVILSANVTQGHVYATVNNNIRFYYIDVRGEAGQACHMTSDSSGLIGITHEYYAKNLSYDSVVAGGWLILPELTDGIVDATISAPAQQSTTPKN